nr:MAG TPA: hypothetical protein [Bacteriophage sp.]
MPEFRNLYRSVLSKCHLQRRIKTPIFNLHYHITSRLQICQEVM